MEWIKATVTLSFLFSRGCSQCHNITLSTGFSWKLFCTLFEILHVFTLGGALINPSLLFLVLFPQCSCVWLYFLSVIPNISNMQIFVLLLCWCCLSVALIDLEAGLKPSCSASSLSTLLKHEQATFSSTENLDSSSSTPYPSSPAFSSAKVLNFISLEDVFGIVFHTKTKEGSEWLNCVLWTL